MVEIKGIINGRPWAEESNPKPQLVGKWVLRIIIALTLLYFLL